MIPRDIIEGATSRAGVVRVRNALNPALWACAVVAPVCFAFAFLFRDDAVLRYGLVGPGALPILVTVAAYFFFMLRSPDHLQSEEYRIRQQALHLLYRRGHSTDIVDVANQQLRIETGRNATRPDRDPTT